VSTDPFSVVIQSPLALSGSPGTAGIAGTPYSATLTVSGESGAYEWTVTGAPSWMTVTQSGAGNDTLTLSGTPTGLESDTITISAKDMGTLGDTASKTVSLSTQLQVMSIATSQSSYFVLTNNGATLPAPAVTGVLGTPTYTLLSGTTPVTSACGLAFDSRTGIISGTVQSSVCNANYTMKVVDSNGSSATSGSFNINADIAAPGAQVSAPFGSPINARATAPAPYTGFYAVSNFVGDWVFQTTSSSISPTTAGSYPALTYTMSQASDCSTARAANYKVGGTPAGSTQGTCLVYYAAPVPNNAIVTYNITAYNQSGSTKATAGSFVIRVTNPFAVNFPSGTLQGTLGTAFTAPLPTVVSAGGSVSWSLVSAGSGCSGVSVTLLAGGQVKVTSPAAHCTQTGITVKAVDSYDTSPAQGTFAVSF
jgi:large repetitive protein